MKLLLILAASLSFLPKSSKLVHVYQTYHKLKVSSFGRHGVHVTCVNS